MNPDAWELLCECGDWVASKDDCDKVNCDREAKQVEEKRPLYSVYTFLAWLKDNRRRATKDYGQAAEQGTNIEKTFEAGFSSAMDHLVDEFKEEFEIYDGPRNVEELEEGRRVLDKLGDEQ